jgi:hypothetical protein
MSGKDECCDAILVGHVGVHERVAEGGCDSTLVAFAGCGKKVLRGRGQVFSCGRGGSRGNRSCAGAIIPPIVVCAAALRRSALVTLSHHKPVNGGIFIFYLERRFEDKYSSIFHSILANK